MSAGAGEAADGAVGDAPQLEARGLEVRYGGQRVLHDVDLAIHAGEFVGIVGPNGGGKTTLLRALLGLVRPARGEVRLAGRPPRRRAVARVGYVPQHAIHVDRGFPASALEVALLGRVGRRGLLRRWSAADRRAAREALERVGVAHLAGRRVGTLSGGERQRVFLAKALASEPEVLILDEPTAGVDPKARENFYNLVDGLSHRGGLTVLLVTHDVQAVELCCHRLVAVNHTVVYDGPADAFRDAGGLSEAYDMHLHHHHHGHGDAHDHDHDQRGGGGR